MVKLDSDMEKDIEAKVIEINKLDTKLHLAKLALRDAICEAICSMLPNESDRNDIAKAARMIRAYNLLDLKEKKAVVDMVWNRLN